MPSNMDADYAKIVERAWRDGAFKARLLKDPNATLKEAGISIPKGLTLKVVEDTENLAHIILPPKPKETEAKGDMCCGSCAP